MAEWLCSGLQSRGRRFDSDPSLHFSSRARVAELVDAADLKSAVRKDVPVRVRPWAPTTEGYIWASWRCTSTFQERKLSCRENLSSIVARCNQLQPSVFR